MSMVESSEFDIFLSYRRATGKYIAQAINRDLTARGYRVFQDIRTLDGGPFPQQILEVIEKTPDFLVMTNGRFIRFLPQS